jgi:hypothetical protein
MTPSSCTQDPKKKEKKKKNRSTHDLDSDQEKRAKEVREKNL